MQICQCSLLMSVTTLSLTRASLTKAIAMSCVIVPVTKEIILYNKAVQWNRNLMTTFLIACTTSCQNCGDEISIQLEHFVGKYYLRINLDYCLGAGFIKNEPHPVNMPVCAGTRPVLPSTGPVPACLQGSCLWFA